MPHSWEEHKLLLSTASQTETQGTVNYPYVTDPLVGGAFDTVLSQTRDSKFHLKILNPKSINSVVVSADYEENLEYLIQFFLWVPQLVLGD